MLRSTALLGILLATAWPLPAVAGKGGNPNGKPFVEIQGQIVEVEGEISTLQDQVDALAGEVDSIEGRVAANEAAILQLETTTEDLQAQIDANADDIASLEFQVVDLEAANSDLQAQINDLGDPDGWLQAQIDANNATITTLKQSIADASITLQAQIKHNKKLIAVLKAQLAVLNKQVAMKQNVINGRCPDGSAISHVFPNGSVACEYDDFGTGSGELDAYQTYSGLMVPAGEPRTLEAHCASDYIPTFVGYASWEMDTFWTFSKPVPGGYGTIQVLNTGSYDRQAYVYVTCVRVR